MNVNKDLSYAFTLSRQCLRAIGIWPDPHVPLSDMRRPSIRFIIVACIVGFYVFTPQMVNVIRAWGNVSRMVENFSSANFSMIALCKLIVTWYHGETLRTLMTSIMTDWMTSRNDWQRNTMLRIARRGRSLSFKCCVAATGTIVFYLSFHLIRFYHNVHLPHRNLVYRLDKIQKSPNYEIIYFMQLSGGTYTVITNFTIDSFIMILVLHICAQLINLRTAINNLVAKLVNRSISFSQFREGLTMIVTRHKHLIRNAKMIDDCYSAVLFVHVFAATFQLCFITFQVYTMIADNLDVPVIRMIFLSFYIANVVMHLYGYCYSAERLMIESTSMAYGVYECKWYELSSKDARDLMFIVYRSMIPLKLTAGKFGTFSLEMFTTAVKTSMGYLSVLLTIKD